MNPKKAKITFQLKMKTLEKILVKNILLLPNYGDPSPIPPPSSPPTPPPSPSSDTTPSSDPTENHGGRISYLPTRLLWLPTNPRKVSPQLQASCSPPSPSKIPPSLWGGWEALWVFVLGRGALVGGSLMGRLNQSCRANKKLILALSVGKFSMPIIT